MITTSINRLEELCQTIPALLTKIPEAEFAFKATPSTWSKKEILGHLIDSATNNHQRFVRTQFEDIPHISYQQDHWVASSRYIHIGTGLLISFWTNYNQMIAEIVKRIPTDDLQRTCRTGEIHTIEWLFKDYVEHLEHHLHQIVEYN